MQPIYAVLTGDLINSTEAGAEALQASMQVIAGTAQAIGHWPGCHDTRFTRSRGDGWQMVLNEPGDALRMALMLQASLRGVTKGIPTRISIGLGRVDSLGSKDLSDASGPAFTASGQGLDHMYRLQTLSIRCEETPRLQAALPFLQAILALADELARRWTREQAEAMALALQPHSPTLAEMAAQLAISSQAVNYRLAGAGLRAVRLALRGWEDGFDMHPIEDA